MKEKIKKIITEITLEKAIKLSIILAILLVGFAVFYHYVIFPPQAERKLNQCLTDAEFSYRWCWNSQCRLLGREENCELPFERADICKKQRKEDKDYCFKKYPVK